MFFPFLECRSSGRQQEIQAVRESPCQVMVSPVTSGRHMAIPEVDKSLKKASREIPAKGKSENGRTLKRMVGLGGLEPPTSPLSGAFMVLYA